MKTTYQEKLKITYPFLQCAERKLDTKEKKNTYKHEPSWVGLLLEGLLEKKSKLALELCSIFLESYFVLVSWVLK